MTNQERAREIVRDWYDEHIQTVILPVPDRFDLVQTITAALDQAAQPVWRTDRPMVVGKWWYREHKGMPEKVVTLTPIDIIAERFSWYGEWAGPLPLPREAQP